MNTPDQQQLSAFEEHLLAQLKNVVATSTVGAGAPRPARAGRRPRRRLVLAAGAAVAVAAAAGASVFALRTPPAYAVERDPDGSIRVSVYDYRDPKGLQQRIEAFGVKAAVDYLPAGMTCQESRADFVPADRMPLAMVDWAPLSSEEHYFRLHPQYIGPGQTFVYTVQLSEHSQRVAIRLANGPVGPCVPVPGDVVPGHGG